MINVLDRITQLRENRHWTEYQLADKSGLTQSTISSWYRKDILPTIPSLEKICTAFDISLSQFFEDDSNTSVYINERQKKLLSEVGKLNPRQVDALITLLEDL